MRLTANQRLSGLLGCLLIGAAACLAYHNSLRGPFVFDDESSITGNTTLHHLWPLGTVLHPPGQGTTVSGRPFLNLSFAVNYALGGLNVFGYHLVNLLIHSLAGMVLFGIVRRILTGLPAKDKGENGDSQSARAFTVGLGSALLWTVHPLQTESVNYIAQRAESLMGLLYLLAVYCFIRGTGLGGGPPTQAGRRCWFSLALAACALGMATKEVMVTAPLVILLMDRTFISGSFRQALRQRWPVYAGFACTWVGLAFLVASAGFRGGTAGFGTVVSGPSYASDQVVAIVHYLRLSLWPDPLVFDYGRILPASRPQWAVDAAVLLGLLIATAFGVWRGTGWGFLGAWFFLILAPSSSVLPIATEIMAEHRMYLPLAAVAVGCGALVYQTLRSASWLAIACLVSVLGFITAGRNEFYRSPLLLWSDTIRKVPMNAGAHNNLGIEFLAKKNVPAAIREFSEAVRLNSSYLGARVNLGTAFFRAGRFSEAVECFAEVLAKHPDFVEGHKMLGLALAADRRPEEAVAQLREVLRAEPDNIEARRYLGRELIMEGRPGDAIPEFQRVVAEAPENAEAQSSLGDALLATHRPAEAIPHYEKALQLAPRLAIVRTNLGGALLLTGKPNEAISSLEAALQIQPENINAHRNLGLALQSIGRVEEARQQFERAEQLRNPQR